MKFSKATNYALHIMLMMVEDSTYKPVGVQRLAESLGGSPTYLSKILSKLTKSGLINSTIGANGGYRLSQRKDEITFLDIIHAIEGNVSFFECEFVHNSECLIQKVMLEAEEKMEQHLRRIRIVDLTTGMAYVTVEREKSGEDSHLLSFKLNTY